MDVSAINGLGFGATINYAKAAKSLNRSALKQTASGNKALFGPDEVRRARNWVAAYTAGNATIAAATAQAAGAEEFLLAGVEVIMATHILNGIYDFKLSKTALKNIGAGATGHIVGKATFKWMSKGVTWIPIFGNGINALVAGSTTAAIGAFLIDTAEKMEKELKRNKSLDEFIKKLGGK